MYISLLCYLAILIYNMQCLAKLTVMQNHSKCYLSIKETQQSSHEPFKQFLSGKIKLKFGVFVIKWKLVNL